MGRHAFDATPEHRRLYEVQGLDAAPLHGAADGWNMPTVRHRLPLDEAACPGVAHYVLTVHLGGRRVRRVDDDAFRQVARTGAVSLQPPGDGGVFRSDGLVDYGHLYFRGGLLAEVGEELGLGADADAPCFFARTDPELSRECGLYVRRASDVTEPALPIEMDSRAYLIGLALLRAVRGRTLADRQTRPLPRHDMRLALEVIEDRLDAPLRLSDLADAMGLGPFHFARLFRRTLGETPASYLMRRRTERAVDLIRTTDLPLAVIAFRTGFAGQSHMTRRVKAMTGTTPKRLRD